MEHLGINVIFEGKNLIRLLDGLWVTARVAIISMIIGGVLGLIIGAIRTTKIKVIQFIFRLYLELFRIIPILVWLFVFYYILPQDYNLDLNAEEVSILVFSLWIAAEMSDIVRSAISSVPKHQIEAGKAIGLNIVQVYTYVLVPQAVRYTIPATINLTTRVIKTTSLLVMIGLIELIKVGQQIIEFSSIKDPSAPFWIYGFIFILYFALSYPLSKLSRQLEKKYSQG
ncbi:amino acid ABC transporter permease [Niallia sp. 01092]|uniref:amino acid ABC transporter permease n=1 Tax=unclassified Niallia TaxID=2837522 RepID=UPI003FD01930